MGFETKILTAISTVAPHRASFTCGTLSIVDVTPSELDEITELIRDVSLVPFNVRQAGDEILIDFDDVTSP